MSDSFFQKKRKRPSKDGEAKTRPLVASRVKTDAKAGPSRLRMRDQGGKSSSKAARSKGRGTGDGDDEYDNDDDNESDGGVGMDGMDLRHRYDSDVQESDEDNLETPAEAKVRLAKLYLQGLQDDDVDPNDADAAEADRQNIAARLQADVSSQSSHIHNFVAERIKLPLSGDTSHILAARGHQSSVTAILIEASCKSFWTAAKDGQMIRWRLKDGKMLEKISKREGEGTRHTKQRTSSTSGAARRRARAALMMTDSNKANGVQPEVNGQNSLDMENKYCRQFIPKDEQGHSDEIWAMAASSDGKYIVSGGKDRRICIWSLESGQATFIKALGGHKDSITALQFRMGSHDLFTASSDRTLKLFDVSQLSYVETFFGHQEEVSSLDLLRGEVAVSAGSRDRTVRWWKVRDESQLVFRGGAKSKVRDVLEGGDLYDEDEGGRKSALQEQWVEGSIDSVAMIDEHSFLSGGDSGTISLWSLSKKKPIFTAPVAHGFQTADTSTEGKVQTPRWITSLACLPYGDVFASGSWDGRIRLWKLHSSLKSFSPLLDVPVEGSVNSLKLVLPSRSVLKKQGRLIDESAWRRKGGLRGGAKKVFDEAASTTEALTINSVNESASEGSGLVILAAGVGQEPSRGRWLRLKEAKNGAVIVPLYLS